jgi:hypothetical protein
MLKAGSIFLYLWSALNLLMSSLILVSVLVLKANSPLLGMVLDATAIVGLDPKAILALNTLTILYNSYAVAFSVLAWVVIRSGLSQGKAWAFWTLAITIGLVEILAFVASAPIGHARWQVNVFLSALYASGIGLSGYSLLRRGAKEAQPRGRHDVRIQT